MSQESPKSLDKFLAELREEVNKRPLFKIEIPAPIIAGSQPTKKDIADLLELGRWLNVVKHPSVIAILGNRGSGKSALGYKILEYMKWMGKIYVVGLPEKAQRILPDWIGSVPLLEDVPHNSIVLIDEAYILLHARSSTSQRARELSNLIN